MSIYVYSKWLGNMFNNGAVMGEQERSKNKDRHAELKKNLDNAYEDLTAGKLDESLRFLNMALQESASITCKDDISDYIDPKIINNSAQMLTAEIILYNQRCANQIANIINTIVDAALQQRRLDSIEQESVQMLSRHLNEQIRANWHKIDRRDNSVLTTTLATKIANDLQEYNCLSKCCYSGDCDFGDQEILFAALTKDLQDYAPANPPLINLPIFADRVAKPTGILYNFIAQGIKYTGVDASGADIDIDTNTLDYKLI